MDSKEKKNDVKEEKLEDIIRSIRGIIDDHNNHTLKNLKGDKENPNLDESILELTSEFKESEISLLIEKSLVTNFILSSVKLLRMIWNASWSEMNG